MILYVKYNDSGAILIVSDGPINDADAIEIQDDSYIQDPNSIYNYKIVDQQFVKIEEEEKKQLYPFLYPDEIQLEKAMQETSLQAMMTASARNSFLAELPDTDAAKLSLCYDPWKTDTAYKVGDRVLCDGKLWKCHQAHTSQENWKPSINTASLWEVINVENAGTLDDPIPYDQTMTVYNGKYYLEEGIIYKCIRDSGQPLHATCASLVGNYFEVVA
jgi:hypothetical protein